jgi:CHAT domain-containing protein
MQFMKKLCFYLISCFFSFSLLSQSEPGVSAFEQIQSIEYTTAKSSLEKLKLFYALKTEIENNRPLNDSAYILVLLKISKYEYKAENNLTAAINFATTALHMCNKLKNENFKSLKINCYYNLGFYFQKLMLDPKALACYDTVILLCKKNFLDTNYYQLDARYYKADIYFFSGDYQKVVDECIIGMNLSLLQKDSSYYLYFLNRLSQALAYENKLQDAIKNTHTAITIAKKTNNEYELSNALKILGSIYEKESILDSAEQLFKQSIKMRNPVSDIQQIVNDYIDLGNFYLNDLKDFKNARKYYYEALFYASKINYIIDRNLKLALANLNLGETSLQQRQYTDAEKFFLTSFTNLQINLFNNLKNNPISLQLSKISNKDLVIVLMNDKTNLLLAQYKKNPDKTFLTACLQSAIVTDSVITQIRHEQSGEQSKLYWRDKTRDFYTTAIEACYMANNSTLAFFFMEKSRAALLNDKLNELSASSYLSPPDAAKQENYQIKIIELEQKLNTVEETSNEFKNTQLQLLDAKNDFEHYIKSLELKYPAYYQYKYEDAVPSLAELQSYLKKNNQSFVHYFMGDSTTYILAISSNKTKFIRLSQSNFNKEQLSLFLQLCANKEALNHHYNSFALLSNNIYKKIFQPLQVATGRVIICADNIIIPFDALCKDVNGKYFLLNDYMFSYVYSARSLMKQFNTSTTTGNFLGFAPVSFAPYLNVRDLKNAGIALHASAVYYNKNKIFTNQDATRNNFFKYVSSYSVVSIFSHARADTTDNEPVLYMQDSVIHLSELQLLNKPATKLVLLSACQTNVGKSATGEGIYSLARGFATAGISSVAATLWKADEEAIYNISEKFNEYLSEGMNKDEALQKAKLYFIQSNSNSEKLLPYYWSNMVLIGNTDAIKLQSKKYIYDWIVSGTIILICIASVLLVKKNKNKKLI